MKKRNWTLLCLIGGIVCFGLFGVYNLIAKGQETFELEDISGDRAFLADFPLEGYAGDHVNSLEFTIVDGKLDVKHHPYSTDVLANIRLGREAGRNPLGAYFSPTQNREFYSAETEAVPTEKATLEREKVSNVQRFSEYLEEYQYGETITADRTDIYLEVSGFSGGKRKTARFPSGLTLTEPILFTYGSVAQNDNGNMFDRNSYKDGFVGEEYGIRTLRSYAAKLGDSIYAVVAPDERCEGTTYIYRVETKKRETDSIPDWSWENEIMDRSTWGEAKPFLPVPDPAERRIVGMEGIDDTYLVVFLTEGQDFIAEVYDAEANLIGSARKTLELATDGSEEYKNAKVQQYLRANYLELFYVPWEEGVSLRVEVTDRVIFEENLGNTYDAEGERETDYDATTGNLLLWITPDGVEQSDYDGSGRALAIRGDKILRLTSIVAPEKENMTEILGGYTPETKQIEVLDGNTLKTLYQGRLKNDFWQDIFKEMPYVDNAGMGRAKTNPDYIYRLGEERAVCELQPIGGRSGDRW